MMKDDLVKTFNIYFDWAKGKITFLHLELDISCMDMFNVIHDGKLMDVSSISQPNGHVTSHALDSQVDPEADKPMEDATLVLTYGRDNPKEKLVPKEA